MKDEKNSGPVLDRIDPFTDKPYPSKEDYRQLCQQLSQVLEKNQQKRKKMSYSVLPSSQALIKNMSEKSGTNQGGIVDLAPYLFGALVRQSMTRRRDRISILEDIVKQIIGSLQGMILNAPHLEVYIRSVIQMVNEILEMEKQALEDNNIQGVNPEKFSSLSTVDSKGLKPSFYKEIEAFVGQENQLAGLFKTLFCESRD